MTVHAIIMKKISSIFLSILLGLSTFITNVTIEPLFALGAQVVHYSVVEDAYIRTGSNASKNYSYENITSAHGSQYVGLNYKVINAKYNSNAWIIPVMKFNLPTKSEVETNGFDTYKFTFSVFKNPNINEGDQIYHFYYIEDTNWSESSITYNNKPSTLNEDANLLCDFTIIKGTEYEGRDETFQRVQIDVSDKIQSLIDKGITSITVFAYAVNDLNTSLMIHSKESADGSRAASIDASDENRTVYNVSADAYVRNGSNASKNYNYENITSAHGAQYSDAGYKVLNTKNNANSGIIQTVMKVSLPSAEEVSQLELNQYYLEFNIFKNADPSTGDQTYRFYYTTDTNWSETSVTYNNAPSDVKNNNTNLLASFDIKKDFAYESKGKDIQNIKLDITDGIQALIKDGVSEITIYTNAQNAMNTSLMMHSRESADGTLTPRLIASKMICTKEDVSQLLVEAQSYDESLYTSESFAMLQDAMNEAELLLDCDSTNNELWNVYQSLKKAIQQLELDVDVKDPENIAYGKATRSNLSKNDAYRVTDGDTSTYWRGKFYPSYVDVDLMDTYDLTKVELYVPSGKTVWYTLYGSNDGEHYDRLYQSRERSVTDGTPFTIEFETVQSYRILRAYIEYTKGEDYAYLSELKAYGTPNNTNKEALRKGTLQEILDMKAYSQTTYAQEITEAETIENVYGIIDRVIGEEYRDWFSFEIANNTANANDYFELSDQNGKIHIKGNEGLSLARGLNHYLKYYAHVLVSQQTISGKMPEQIVPIKDTVRKETPYSIRYAYNYCTLSYTYAFYGEEEWQRENDWLALSGVNVVLDLAGQEATWIYFLMNFGYSFDDAKDWLCGPSYYAWQFMDNMESFGGPVPDDYIIDRVELARKSQRWKNSLGMQTILQGYAGMVPTNFTEFVKDVNVISQGSWNGFSRPSMIATDSDTYDEYAALFYEAQEFVYGNRNHYYAVDPFHEGGIRPSGLSDETISEEVLKSMTAYDEDAVWVVQGWQSNPTNALLKGMEDYREDHVLIVDLIKYPITSATKYDGTSYGSTTLDAKEFNGTPWAWTLLANFGGNPTMNAQLEVMCNDILNASKTSQYMKGLGVISEAMNDNPMVYALIFDLAWENEDFNLNQWMKDYLVSRYGSASDNVLMAWETIKDSAYDYGVRFTPEVYGTKNKTPQSYGSQNIAYGAEKMETAIRLMLRDFDRYCDNSGYLYDLNEMLRQHVSNYSVLKYNEILTAINNSDLETFKVKKAEFINSLEVLNLVASTQKEQLGGEWIGKAQDRSAHYDDFSKDTFEMNAKALITSWGSYAGHRSLKDYGWRNYEGIFSDLYAKNWIDYLNRVEANMESGVSLNNLSVNDYFDVYWEWILGKQEYTRDAKDSAAELSEVATRVLAQCSINAKIDANIGNLALHGISEALNEDIFDSSKAHDGDQTTVFNSDATSMMIDLLAHFDFTLVQIVYDSENDIVVKVSNDKESWITLGQQASDEVHTYDFKGFTGSYRYIMVESATGIDINEVRAYGEKVLPDLDMLNELCMLADEVSYRGSDSDVNSFVTALDNAKAGVALEVAPDEVNALYWTLYDCMCQLSFTDIYNLALNKPVQAHNDPSGESLNLTNGDVSSSWNAGRLSATGKPYEETITEGWAIVDLEGVYILRTIEVMFNMKDYWHKYEVYTSLDGDDWTLIGAKTTETVPNATEDTYQLDGTARYVKLQLKDVQEGSDGKRIGLKVGELYVYGKEYKEADYSEVQSLIQQATELKENILDFSSIQSAIDAVVYGKDVSLQNEVDAYAQAIRTAIESAIYIPSKVESLNAIIVDYKTIQVSWEPSQYATTYKVERKDSTTEEWIVVDEVSQTSYTYATAKTGKEYTYRVTAVNEYAASKAVEVKATTSLQGEVELTITPNGTNKFDLSWTSVEGATRYIIYRKASDGEWKKVLTLGKDARTYTSNALKANTYSYIVKAARYDSVDRVMTNGSNVVEGIVGLETMVPTNVKAETNGTTITLSFDKVVGMTNYEIYRSKDGGVYRQIKRTTDTTITSSGLKVGSTYQYKIRAFSLVNGEKVYSLEVETDPITIQ